MLNELSEKNDSTAKAARAMGAAGLLKPATAPTTPFQLSQSPDRPFQAGRICVIWYIENYERSRSERETLEALGGSCGLACSLGLAYR